MSAMQRDVIRCDRCGRECLSIVTPQGTAGVYLRGGWWDSYLAPDEVTVCDRCLQSTERYRAEVGHTGRD